jgi:hypothetical protein
VGGSPLIGDIAILQQHYKIGENYLQDFLINASLTMTNSNPNVWDIEHVHETILNMLESELRRFKFVGESFKIDPNKDSIGTKNNTNTLAKRKATVSVSQPIRL